MNKVLPLCLLFAVASKPAAVAEQAELINVAPGTVAVSGRWVGWRLWNRWLSAIHASGMRIARTC